MKKLLHLLTFCLLISLNAWSQGELPVNMYTGSPQIEIPLWTVVSHDLSDPVSLVYNAKGVKLSEPNGKFGVSWDIQAGGSVTREVRGLPDDFTGTGSDRRRGWLYLKYNSSTDYNNVDVTSVSNTADLSASTCSDEQADWNKIWGYGYDNDTQPDIFQYELSGGLSGSFVFDNSTTPVIRLIPYRDLQIVPSFESGSKKILGFTITTNTGTVYTLNNSGTEARNTQKLISETTVEFLKTDYELYSKTTDHGNADVIYAKTWMLNKISSHSGDELTYVYDYETITTSEPIKAYIKNYLTTGYSTVDVYSDNRTTTRLHLNSIFIKSGADNKMALSLETTNNLITSIKIRDLRKDPALSVPPVVKQFDIIYHTAASRSFIKEIKELSGSEFIPPYKFDYYNNYLPSATSKSQDFWGYYNGKANTHLAPKVYVYPQLQPSERFRIEPINGYAGTVYTLGGADRTVNEEVIQWGTLKMISYPLGGFTTLYYESNTYYDSIANQSFKGGGLRIKKMTYNDGVNPDVTIEKTFTYADASNKSYGRLISKPVYAMLAWEYRDPFSGNETPPLSDEQVEEKWQYHTVRTEQDMSSGETTQGSPVGYKEVKVYRPGSGYAHFEYDIRAAYGFESVGDWTATQNKFARGTSCPSMGLAADVAGVNSSQYAFNPNFDYERGLLKRKREYNEQNQLVRETTSTYQYIYKTGTTPYKVWGLHFEQYPNSDLITYFFGKYFLLTDVVKVPASETVITYDAANASKNITQTSQYFYESTYHKLLTRTKNITPDGDFYQTYIKYPLDYGTIPSGADKASETIGTLQSTGRNGIPIETYQTIKKGSDNEKVIGGSIVKFNDFGVTGKVLPQYTLSLAASSPKLLSQFTPSYVHATTKLFTPDSDYEVTGTVLGYGDYDRPNSAIGQGRIPSLTVLGYNATVPVVTTSDVTAAQFAFSDFEETTLVSFTAVSNSTEPECSPNPQVCVFYGAGRTGSKSIGAQDMLFSRTLEKRSDRYVWSGWAKHSGATVTFNLKIQNTAKTVTYYNQNLSFTPSTPSGTFEYFEWNIPIDPSLQSFYVEVDVVSGVTYLDDIGFYPSHISLTSYTYTFPFGASSVSRRHATGYTEYDALGRVKYIKDKDGNILQKKTYQFNAN